MADEQETVRVSLLDTVLEQRRRDSSSQRPIVVRLLLLASLGDAAVPEALGPEYTQFFQQLPPAYSSVTGLLLVYPKICLHVVEICEDVVADLMQLVSEQEKRGVFAATRVVLSTACPRTLYPLYSTRVLNISTSKASEYKTDSTIDVVAGQCISSVVSMGLRLQACDKVEYAGFLDNLPNNVPSGLLCTQGMLEHILRSKELDTVAEYIQRYCEPYDTVMDGEIVWPQPARLFPYD